MKGAPCLSVYAVKTIGAGNLASDASDSIDRRASRRMSTHHARTSGYPKAPTVLAFGAGTDRPSASAPDRATLAEASKLLRQGRMPVAAFFRVQTMSAAAPASTVPGGDSRQLSRMGDNSPLAARSQHRRKGAKTQRR